MTEMVTYSWLDENYTGTFITDRQFFHRKAHLGEADQKKKKTLHNFLKKYRDTF